MRWLAFLSLGTAMGYLYFSWVRRATGSVVSRGESISRRNATGMALRLSAFTLVLFILVLRFGALAGAATLAGMLACRALMVRREVGGR